MSRIFSLFFGAVLLWGCTLPLTSSRHAEGVVVIRLATPSRTVVPDWNSVVEKYQVTLTLDGEEESKTQDASTGVVVLEGITAGHWTVDVAALNTAGDVVGVGTGAVDVGSSLSNEVSITLSGTQNGSGSYSFAFSLDAAPDINWVSARLLDDSDAAVHSETLVPDTNPGYYGAKASGSGIDSGRYRLELTFRRGGSSGPIAAIVSEAVNIWDNTISAFWYGPDGVLQTRRDFAAVQFGSSNAALADLVFRDSGDTLLNLAPAFSSGSTGYVIDGQSLYANRLSVRAKAGVDGQRLEYQVASGPWSSLGSDQPSSTVSVAGGASVRVRVTAPDGVTQTVYTTGIPAASFTVTYHANGGTGTVPLDHRVYQDGAAATIAGNSGGLTKTGSTFYGWNTQDDGLGTTGVADGTMTVTGNLDLYALWVDDDFIVVDGVLTGTVVPVVGPLVIPDGVVAIGEEAFGGNEDITSVTFPSSLLHIGDRAFKRCTGITGNLNIPPSVITIGFEAFMSCENVFQVRFGTNSALTTLGHSVFAQCYALNNIELPNGLTTIPATTFSTCVDLVGIDIPAGITSIGANAFVGCVSMASITGMEGLTTLGDNVFQGCTGLTVVDLSTSALTNLGRLTFYTCTSLQRLTIPASLTNLGDQAFLGCTVLERILVESGSATFATDAGAVYSLDSTILYFVPPAFSTDFTVPSTVTRIGDWAFLSCASMTSVTFSDGLLTIGNGAFQGTTLSAVTIPAGVTSLGSAAFFGVGNLATVTMNPASPPTLTDQQVFDQLAAGLQILVPQGSLSAYQNAANWNEYAAKMAEQP